MTKSMVESASVVLPVDDAGQPDLKAQQRAAKRIAPLERDKIFLEDEMRRLTQAEVEVDWMTDIKPW